MRRRRERARKPPVQFVDIVGLSPEGEAAQRMMKLLLAMR
jgi:hypothetical protein